MHKKFLRTLAALAFFFGVGNFLVPHRANAMDTGETKNYRVVVRSTSQLAVDRATLHGPATQKAVYHQPDSAVVALKEFDGLNISFQPTSRIDKIRLHQPVDTSLKLSYRAAVFEFSLVPNAPGSMTFYYDVLTSGIVLPSELQDTLRFGTLESVKKADTGNNEKIMRLEFPKGIESQVGQSVKGFHTVVEIFDRWDKTD